MRAMQVIRPGTPLAEVDLPIREPGPTQVRVRVHACGVCRCAPRWRSLRSRGRTLRSTGYEAANCAAPRYCPARELTPQPGVERRARLRAAR